MNAPFRSSMRELHSRAGLVLGWLGIFLFFMGSLALYRYEITFWMQPETHHAAQRGSTREKIEAARAGLAYLTRRAPDAEMWRVNLPTERSPVPSAAWASGEAVHDPHGMAPELFDPETGRALAARETGGGSFLYRLHVDLFGLDRGVGRKAVGMAALALLLVCVSGVCLRRDFFRNFLAFRPGENRFAFWRDAHGLAGGLTLPFFLVITASGLVLLAQSLLPSTLFPHYRDGARNFVRESKGAGIMQPPSPTARTLPVTPLSEEYGSVPDPAPLLELAARRWPDCGAGSLLIRFHDGNVISMQAVQARSSALSRRSSADLLELRVIPGMDRGEVLDPRTETPPSFIRSVWYAASALHLGRFAAPLPRALLFLSGLLSAGMMAAGLLLWEKARERKTGDSVPKGVYAANTAVIAGLPLSVAAYFWMNRLLDADLPQRATWESLTFFFAWACCLTHAWARDKPAGRGEQLAAAGLALALLPFLNGLTGGEALPDTLFHGPAQLAGFDIFALLAGMGLFGAGFRSLRRSRTASPLHALRGRIAEMLDRTAARVRGAMPKRGSAAAALAAVRAKAMHAAVPARTEKEDDTAGEHPADSIAVSSADSSSATGAKSASSSPDGKKSPAKTGTGPALPKNKGELSC